MKDFYDVWQLIERFEFDGRVMQEALEKTFQNRNTVLPRKGHVIFSDVFWESKAPQWNVFIRKLQIKNSMELKDILEVIKRFLLPLLDASRQGILFDKKWNDGWK